MSIINLFITQVIIILGIPVLLLGSDTIPLSNPPSVTYFQHFTLNEGLIVDCIDKGFVDSKGRLWFNPCFKTANEFSLPFFQFDGEQSNTYH